MMRGEGVERVWRGVERVWRGVAVLRMFSVGRKGGSERAAKVSGVRFMDDTPRV